MRIKSTFSLLTLGLAIVTASGWAQTTPTGAATSTTYPAGAVVSDSAKPSRSQQRAMKRSRANRNSQRNAGSAAATSQEGQYRQSSAANGTAINNSNSTNYNSNNATNAPTGVGSNPSTATQPTTPNGSTSSGMSTTTSGNGGSDNASTTDGATKTGTAAAVTGARTTATPAVVSGSTERNTSIHDFIASSPNYTTLQNALQSAGLYEMLKGSGPYTLFAPSNSAFKKLPATAQAGLLEGRNRDALKQLLSYHVVEGSLDAAELTQRIKTGNGKAQLQTAAGSTLTAQLGSGGRVTITDEQGQTAVVEAPDKLQSNGVVHGVDAVLLPKNGTGSIR